MPVKKMAGDPIQSVPNLPRKIGQKKRRPREVAVVIEDGCTGCEACVPFCPVDCISHVPADTYDDVVIPPVQIRWDECIGCQICVRICDALAWQTIAMVPADEFEERTGVELSDEYPGETQPTSLKQVEDQPSFHDYYTSR